MEFWLDPTPAAAYASASQRARVITEAWGAKNLYCLACYEDRLVPERAGVKVIDFRCRRGHRYQLKAKQGRLGRAITNSAYRPKVEAIRRGEAPTYVFLGYNRQAWTVEELVVVPGHFLTLEAVRPRRPLGPGARRAGWVGSTILLDQLPRAGRIDLRALPPAEARATFQRFADLNRERPEARGWLADVLRIVDQLAPETGDGFRLEQLKGFAGELRERHPGNRHVEEKIRQQLQVLRDRGVIIFEGRGTYLRR